ncbi:enolase-like domain-containing protein [Streptomyces wuyuanensis]|uniref:hypothetical protein n=1 Tax=Streptomyces wuyuanensis TaxID=1196353 RepID=UPI0038285EF1
MTVLRIRSVRVRAILNSGGGAAAEAEVALSDGTVGRGSAPVAIKPGRRERPVTESLRVGRPLPQPIERALAPLPGTAVGSQEALDTWLDRHLPVLGTDVALAVSLAYARAAAKESGTAFHRYLAEQADRRPGYPGLLAAVVSGGLHRPGTGIPFQQIMLATDRRPPSETVPVLLEAYARVEEILMTRGQLSGYSASGGMIVDSLDPSLPLDVLNGVIEGSGLSLAIDVASEHLRTADGYRLGDETMDAEELADRLTALADLYPITFLEDPFTADDVGSWSRLRDRLPAGVALVGDDLYATNTEYIDPALSAGIVLKMNQVGTVTAALRASARASELGMSRCVSHRSLETEDTSVVDLAVAIDADWLKIGGPRRGDRTAKYNRLLWLEDALDAA